MDPDAPGCIQLLQDSCGAAGVCFGGMCDEETGTMVQQALEGGCAEAAVCPSVATKGRTTRTMIQNQHEVPPLFTQKMMLLWGGRGGA